MNNIVFFFVCVYTNYHLMFFEERPSYNLSMRSDKMINLQFISLHQHLILVLEYKIKRKI